MKVKEFKEKQKELLDKAIDYQKRKDYEKLEEVTKTIFEREKLFLDDINLLKFKSKMRKVELGILFILTPFIYCSVYEELLYYSVIEKSLFMFIAIVVITKTITSIINNKLINNVNLNIK